MNTQATPQAPASNALTLEQMLLVADELGKQDALGKDVQVKWDMKVLEAAHVGAIDTTANKHGDGIDDATKLAAAYFKARNGAVIFDHKEPKQRKLCATTRTMVKLGGSPKFGVGQPMQNINNLMTMRQNFRRTANKGTRLEDAHNMLMRYARAQLKEDTLITGDALKVFCFRPDSEPRSVSDWLRKVAKDANAIRNGKLSNCNEQDTSAEISAILNACNKRLSAIAKAAAAGNSQP